MADLPAGTVTFLFTDIEGSTHLARTLGERWPATLARHDEILRSAIADHGGTTIGTKGDAFFAVFTTAPGGVAAATAAQQELAANAWDAGGIVRVRMGLHSGRAQLAGGDYVGLDVHLAARIAAAAHGGQVLLSSTCAGLAADGLPDGVSLRSLGSHRLKDFDRPQPIVQLVIDPLPSEFPPIRTLSAPITMPSPLTAFVGRDRELAQLSDLLAGTRLLTLIGPGGTGKTRLLLQLGSRAAAHYPDGVVFVDLASVGVPALVPSAIVEALQLREGAARSALATVQEYLRDRTSLLMLDNFEHLLEASAVVARILAASPGSTIAVTSRIRLGLMGEQEYVVPPLGVPASGSDLATLATSESVALFVDRARAARASFSLTPENSAAVAEICARLDGLPLALELAAAQLRFFSPAELLARLEQGVRLRTTAANVPERQHTVRNALQWSYEHLTAPERQVFARLSIFAGGSSLEAIEAIADPDAALAGDAMEIVGSLVDQSLLARADVDGRSRFSMLRPIRDFAGELLEAEFDSAATAERHTAFFTGLAERWGPAIRTGEAAVARQVLSREHDNLREAMQWALRADRADLGLRLVTALWPFWVEAGHLAEGAATSRSMLALPSATREPGPVRAAAHVAMAGVVYWQADYASAANAYRAAVEIDRDINDRRRLAEALRDLAYALLAERRRDEAFAIIEECLETAGGLDGSQGLVASATGLRGIARAQRGDLEAALEDLEESLRLFETVPEGSFWGGEARGRIGSVYRLMNRLDEAEAILAEALRRYRALGATVGTAAVMKLMADVASRRGDHERALRLASFAESLDEQMGGGPPRDLLLVETGSELAEATARDSVDGDLIVRWQADGRTMTYDQAMAYALRDGS